MQWLWLPRFQIFDYAIAVIHAFFVTLHSFLLLSMVANLLSRPHRSHPFFRPRCCFHCFESWDEQLEPARSQISSRSIGRHQTSDQDGRFTCMFPVFRWTPFSASCVASFPTVQPQGWNIIASFTKTWQNSFTKKHEPWILECQPCSDEHHVPQNELKSEEGAKHIFDNNKAKICLAGQYEETSGQSQEPYSMFQIYIQIPSCLPSGDNAVNAWRNPALYLIQASARMSASLNSMSTEILGQFLISSHALNQLLVYITILSHLGSDFWNLIIL